MRRKFYRVMFEHPEGKVRRLYLSKRFLTLSVFALIIMTATLFSALFLYGINFQKKSSNMEIKVLKKRTKFLGLENRKYKEELGKLESKLDQLKVLEKKIKETFHIEGTTSGKETAGVGGLGGPVIPIISILKDPSLVSLSVKQEDRFYHDDVEKLWNEALEKEDRFSTILEIIKGKRGYPSFLTPIWPVIGSINSGFGRRSDPLTGEEVFHEGIDISADQWTLIKAAADGKVVFSGWDGNGYGRMIIIDHGNNYLTRYAHNISNNVKVGERVKKGETIGYVGSTGRSTGTHLHFEVRHRNVPTNPMKFFFD